MRAKYIQCSTFVCVLTPHFIEQIGRRSNFLPTTPLSSLFEKMWGKGIEDECMGFSHGGGFVYYKCKWNKGRERWEMELISFTPSNRFHTRSKNFAMEVCLES